MEILEQAKNYAIKAHSKQLRKSNGKPMIYHPLAVGELLKDYGYSESVIAAGYLHDTVEDTPTTMEDIKLLFGAEIAKLVANASEPNKELSWEERKQHTIDLVKISFLDDIVVVVADKIHNLEDLTKELQIQGLSLFNSFKRGVDQQNWYYTAIYEAINQKDQEQPIVKRLATALANFKNEIAYQTELETVIFNDDLELLDKLRELHKLKYQVKEEGYIKPFIIEILGTPRTGKTTIINNILDFLKKGGFKVTYFKELVTSEFYHEINRLPLYERNMAIIDEIVKQLKSVTEQQKIVAKHNEVKDINLRVFDNDGDIIIFDRGIFDRYIWFRRLLDLKEISSEQYQAIITKYQPYLNLVHCLLCFTASSDVAIKRDYISSLALERRSFLSQENVNIYNIALQELINAGIISDYHLINTDQQNINDSAIETATYILQKIKIKKD